MSRTWRTIDMTLDVKSINKAIKEVEKCKKDIVDAMNALIRELQEQGVSVAKTYVQEFNAVDTGELSDSIFGYFDSESRIGYIIANAPHAFYVEYGTGPRGEANPHPEAGAAAWQYMVGPTIHANEQGQVGWYYPGDDGKWHWTQGQPSRPFMYNTLVWLEEAAQSLGKSILK